MVRTYTESPAGAVIFSAGENGVGFSLNRGMEWSADRKAPQPSTDGVSSAGIDAYSTNGSVDISFDSVTTDGSLSDGVIAYAATGVSVTGGAVDVQGMGVFASTVSGDATVNLTGDVTAAGTFTAITGVYAGTGDGEVSITIVGDTVVTAPGIAIGVEAQGAADGAVVDVTGSISATSFFNRAYGVLAMADYGLIEIDVTGAVTASGSQASYGIYAAFNVSEPPPYYGYNRVDLDAPTAAVGDPQTIDITVGGANFTENRSLAFAPRQPPRFIWTLFSVSLSVIRRLL